MVWLLFGLFLALLYFYDKASYYNREFLWYTFGRRNASTTPALRGDVGLGLQNHDDDDAGTYDMQKFFGRYKFTPTFSASRMTLALRRILSSVSIDLKEDLSDELVHGHVSQFVLGGLDTTSNAMAMVAYEVAKRPDVQAKIRAELTASLAKYGGQWTYEMIRDLKYLHSVLNESARIKPVLPFLFRVVTKDYTFDDGLTLKKGDKVVIPSIAFQFVGALIENEYRYPDSSSPGSDAGSNSENKPEIRRGRPKAAMITYLMTEGATSQSGIRCEVCSRVFPRDKSLQAHRRVHTGARAGSHMRIGIAPITRRRPSSARRTPISSSSRVLPIPMKPANGLQSSRYRAEKETKSVEKRDPLATPVSAKGCLDLLTPEPEEQRDINAYTNIDRELADMTNFSNANPTHPNPGGTTNSAWSPIKSPLRLSPVKTPRISTPDRSRPVKSLFLTDATTLTVSPRKRELPKKRWLRIASRELASYASVSPTLTANLNRPTVLRHAAEFTSPNYVTSSSSFATPMAVPQMLQNLLTPPYSDEKQRHYEEDEELAVPLPSSEADNAQWYSKVNSDECGGTWVSLSSMTPIMATPPQPITDMHYLNHTTSNRINRTSFWRKISACCSLPIRNSTIIFRMMNWLIVGIVSIQAVAWIAVCSFLMIKGVSNLITNTNQSASPDPRAYKRIARFPRSRTYFSAKRASAGGSIWTWRISIGSPVSPST
ncbi:unnamed protein product [Nesidiocoris tenuis]|uniref:C2H2-type domain-containing protein n=1 Tax=Nesidiocoris tenuis TaxID=355587 RepID=A0A6H5G168_9HEMI|nr:unnamed protein product [Nesidiocoris tenuis]